MNKGQGMGPQFLKFSQFILALYVIMQLTACGLNSTFKISPVTPVNIDVKGCMMTAADNYKKNATKADNSCVFSRCWDASQDNFNEQDRLSIESYAKKFKLNIKNIINNTCNGRSGCTHALSSNKDLLATKENGSCLFNACLDENYQEYMKYDAQQIEDYISDWGETFNGKNRVTNSCNLIKQYCEHKEAINYTGVGNTLGEEKCTFVACSKINYLGYQKYLQYQEYLKTHKGSIIEDNSDAVCGPKIIDQITREIDIKNERKKVPVRISFIIDDSGSMEDEADKVNQALQDLTPPLISYGADLTLELNQLDDVNKNVVKSHPPGLPQTDHFDYLKPIPVKQIKINNSSNADNIRKDINGAMDQILQRVGSSQEQGLCFIQRLMEDYKNSADKNLITVLVTDEDDNFLGSSKNCYAYSEVNNLVPPSVGTIHIPYQDQQGKDDLVNVITENALSLPSDKTFSLISIHWDKDKSVCTSYGASHAANYIRLVNQLKAGGKRAMTGDVCAEDYYKLLDTTLADTILDIIGYRYQVAKISKKPVIKSVSLIQANGNVSPIAASSYKSVVEGEDLYIEFSTSLKEALKNSKKIQVIVEEVI